MGTFKYAIVKFNGGHGALLCNSCYHIIREAFVTEQIADKEYLCKKCDAVELPSSCPKGMEYDKCPFNPRLGCDCGVHKPRR